MGPKNSRAPPFCLAVREAIETTDKQPGAPFRDKCAQRVSHSFRPPVRVSFSDGSSRLPSLFRYFPSHPEAPLETERLARAFIVAGYELT